MIYFVVILAFFFANFISLFFEKFKSFEKSWLF